jgi:small redox-active disulfide protein 2
MPIPRIIVFGANCGKCKRAEARLKKVIEEEGVLVEVVKSDDLQEMMKYKIHYLPSIIIDDVVQFKGIVPSEKEILKALLKFKN